MFVKINLSVWFLLWLLVTHIGPTHTYPNKHLSIPIIHVRAQFDHSEYVPQNRLYRFALVCSHACFIISEWAILLSLLYIPCTLWVTSLTLSNTSPHISIAYRGGYNKKKKPRHLLLYNKFVLALSRRED